MLAKPRGLVQTRKCSVDIPIKDKKRLMKVKTNIYTAQTAFQKGLKTRVSLNDIKQLFTDCGGAPSCRRAPPGASVVGKQVRLYVVLLDGLA